MQLSCIQVSKRPIAGHSFPFVEPIGNRHDPRKGRRRADPSPLAVAGRLRMKDHAHNGNANPHVRGTIVKAVEPPLLVMLVGLPGSGKSTAAVRLAEAIRSQGRAVDIVGTDAYLEAEARRRGLSYAKVFAEDYDAAKRRMREQAREAIRQRRSVIWDQTNLTMKARNLRLRLFPEEYLRIAAVMPTPDHKAWEHNLSRPPGRAVPRDVFDRMRAEFQRPSMEEGFKMFV